MGELKLFFAFLKISIFVCFQQYACITWQYKQDNREIWYRPSLNSINVCSLQQAKVLHFVWWNELSNSYCPNTSFPYLLLALTFMSFILLFSNVVYSASLSRLNSTHATKSSCNHPPPTAYISMRWHISYMAHTANYTNVIFFFPFFPPGKFHLFAYNYYSL